MGTSGACRGKHALGVVLTQLRDIVIVENIRLDRLLDPTVDFGVKTNAAMLTPIFKLREKSKSGIQSCLYTVTITLIFAQIF